VHLCWYGNLILVVLPCQKACEGLAVSIRFGQRFRGGHDGCGTCVRVDDAWMRECVDAWIGDVDPVCRIGANDS